MIDEKDFEHLEMMWKAGDHSGMRQWLSKHFPCVRAVNVPRSILSNEEVKRIARYYVDNFNELVASELKGYLIAVTHIFKEEQDNG